MNYLLGIAVLYFSYLVRNLIGALNNMSDQVAELTTAINELNATVAAEKAEGQARVAELEAKIAELEAVIASAPGAPDLSAQIAAIRQAAADVSAIFVTPAGPPTEEVAPPVSTEGQ